jgi:hypothetical protein
VEPLPRAGHALGDPGVPDALLRLWRKPPYGLGEEWEAFRGRKPKVRTTAS